MLPFQETTVEEVKMLRPPFSVETSLRCSSQLSLPHAVRHENQALQPKRNTAAFLETDLRTPRLDKVYSHLWLAGLPRAARPLHGQTRLLRSIHITESPDEHLVWHENHIFVKPLPDYLLNYEFWDKELCGNNDLYESACGLLLSYSWLVCYRSDLQVANDVGLVSRDISYEAWTSLMTEFVDCVENSLPGRHRVSRRYDYGELRLSRLNTLYHIGGAGFSMENLVRGFLSGSIRYTTFFERNFSWIVSVFIYITVVLSAMQVALSTEKFEGSFVFQRFSYSIAMLSIVFVFAATVVILVVWWVLFWFHLLSTIKFNRKIAVRRTKALNGPE